MPYDINNYSPTYGGVINSSGNVVNVADSLDEATGQFKAPAMKLFTFQTGATATGNGTPADVSGYTVVVVQNTISATATVTYEVSQDGTTYVTVVGQNIGTFGSLSATGSASGQVKINIAGSKWFRVRISTYGSGTVDVIGYASMASNFYTPYAAAFGGSDTNSAGQTLQGNGAYNLLYDGTNWVRQRSGTAVGDTTTGTGFTANALWGFNGTNFDRLRTGTVDSHTTGLLGTVSMGWSSGSAYTRQRFNDLKGNKFLGIGTFTAATEYLVLTPTSGKTLRIMGISVNCTSVGNVFIRDGSGGNFHSMSFATAKDTQTFYFGNGYLFGAANNSLYIYNNTTTGSAWITVWGTEE